VIAGTGGIFNVVTVDIEALPLPIRTLLIQSGAQGVSTAPKIDKDAPITAAFLSGPQGTNGWYTAPVSVALIPTDIDGPSDIAATTFSLDGSSVVAYTAPFVVSGNGTHNIQFGSVDQAGNAETPRPSQVISIDATPPSLTLPNTVTANASSSSGTQVSYNVTASDTVDPHPIIACMPASGSTFAVGTTVVNCTATDLAGNKASGKFNVNVIVAGMDDLALGMIAPLVVQTGKNLSYLIGVANLGTATAYQAVVTDTLPAGTAFVSAFWRSGSCSFGTGGVGCSPPSQGTSCAYAVGTVICNIGTLPVFTLRNPSGAAILITVRVTAPARSTIKNTASVTGANVDTHPGNNSSTAITVISAGP
jgi:uncharacterized repeat protein (TIGR01451 family)